MTTAFMISSTQGSAKAVFLKKIILSLENQPDNYLVVKTKY